MRTHCPSGHLYSGTNNRGHRICHVCNRVNQKKYEVYREHINMWISQYFETMGQLIVFLNTNNIWDTKDFIIVPTISTFQLVYRTEESARNIWHKNS